jgi:acyl carrier protein
MGLNDGAIDRIRGILLEHLHIDIPSQETDLIDTGALDSLRLVDLIFHIEREFKIRIPLESVDVKHFRNMVEIAAFVSRLGVGQAVSIS